jgi:hypothetical protein
MVERRDILSAIWPSRYSTECIPNDLLLKEHGRQVHMYLFESVLVGVHARRVGSWGAGG